MTKKLFLLTLAFVLLLLPQCFTEAKDLVGKKIQLKNEYCWTLTPGTTRVRHMCLQYCDGRTRKDKEGVGCGPRTGVKMNCTGKPANSYYVSDPFVISNWDEAAGRWLPSSTAQYTGNMSASGGCRFTCNADFKREAGSCVDAVPSAGITHDPIKGTITISDGTIFYTMQDKNLGATVAGTGIQTDASNCSTCWSPSIGNFYQRGNNYPFPSSGGRSTVSNSAVDTSNYGPPPKQWYYSGTYVQVGAWTTNDNLR
jgi:hypothetical protein